MKKIPIKAAKDISQKYDYDQVIIIARKVGIKGGEHVTTYGKDRIHCVIASKTGNFVKYKIMKWREN